MIASMGRRCAALMILAAAVPFGGPGSAVPLHGQSAGVAELAAKLTGSWKLNPELSPGLANPRPGREGRRGAAPGFGVRPIARQRGGRGGGGRGGESGADLSNLAPAERAAQAALSVIQQVPLEMSVRATPSEVEFVEPRGRSFFRIDGKSTAIDVPGGSIKVKSRWDRGGLRQEFSSVQQMLLRTWSIDVNDRLVVTEHIESVTFRSKDTQAVFDRQ